MGQLVHAPVKVGETLAGKYKIEKIIGAGGMGVVVAATHLALDQKVAIKFLLTQHVKDEELVARFAREARALAKIECDHVARVMDVGTLDDGASYMVMEYLEGKDLSGVIRERGAIPEAQAITWVLEACEAVTEAHNAGIIHRDLKPANLFLAQRKGSRKTIVKVLDFGISKSMGSAATADMLALTKTAALLGSPLYMAPEQLHAVRDLDGRTDIWALGVILYELLTGKPPFLADSLGALVSAIQHNEPEAPHVLAPDVSPELSVIVMKCLAKKREDRFQTAPQLMAALLPFGLRTTSLPPDHHHHHLQAHPVVSNLASTAPISPAAVTTGPRQSGEVTGPPQSSDPRLASGNTLPMDAKPVQAVGIPEGSARESAWAGTKGGRLAGSTTGSGGTTPEDEVARALRRGKLMSYAGIGALVVAALAGVIVITQRRQEATLTTATPTPPTDTTTNNIASAAEPPTTTPIPIPAPTLSVSVASVASSAPSTTTTVVVPTKPASKPAIDGGGGGAASTLDSGPAAAAGADAAPSIPTTNAPIRFQPK